MNVLQSALLGLVQGLGEFLPISSSGHLLLVRFLMGIQNSSVQIQSSWKILDILLHVGTLIPLLLIFWKDWWAMLRHPVRNKTLVMLFVASLPTLLVYIGAKTLFPGADGFAVFDSGWFLGASFLITAVFLLVCDLIASRRRETDKRVGFIQAVIMGFFQGIGLIPGVSRSGSTILGGVLSGLDKKRAASFSFMMSAPAILGSLLMEGKDAFEEGLFENIDLVPVAVGIAVAAVTGFLALRFMLTIISTVPLSRFAVYLAVIGIVYLVFQLAGSSLLPPFSSVPVSAV